MGDLKSSRAILIKGSLFLLMGLMASLLVILQTQDLQVTALLCLSIWAFCRFYYFAFYVIEHYVDSSYRFTGLIDFVRYLIRRRSR